MMLAAAAAVAAVSARASGDPAVSVGWAAGFSATVLAILAFLGTYRVRFAPHLFEDIRSILAATAIAAMAITFWRVLLSDDPHAAGQAVRAWTFAATYLSAGRAGEQLMEARRRRRGEAGEPTVIVGAGRVGHMLAKRLQERPEFGLAPVAFYDNQPLELEDGSDLPVLGVGESGPVDRDGLAAQLAAAVHDRGVRHVIVTFSLASHETELELMRRLQELGVSVSIIPRLFEGVPDQTRLERLGGLPLISVLPSDPRGWQMAIKYAMDRVLALVAIVLLSPILLAAAAGTALTLGRPVLFRQRRVGRDGTEFDLLKFRTMRPLDDSADIAAGNGASTFTGAKTENGVAPGGVEGIDRRTRFGAFLRRASLDELPQLFNVLRGEMSLIGPRPERVSYAREFTHAVYRYPDRHRVKSGITGWAQVHGLRGQTSLADRVEWDNYYIENWSPWLDFKIVLLTLRALVHSTE